MSDETTEPTEPTEVPEVPEVAETPTSAPDPDPVHVELLARIDAALGDAVIESADALGGLVVRVRTDAWGRVAEIARDALECDYLSFVAGIDWMPAPPEGDGESADTSSPVQPTTMTYGAAGSAGRFQVFGIVQSTSRHWGVTFKADVDESDPVVASWVGVYPGADWHERECWEMYGIRFVGHPALRRLYLPSEFEGYPLRKDFPLLARVVKPWPGLVDVEGMPGDEPAAVAAAGGEE
ncbi:MAG: NADH-quinone oxidoreductase subunit C [Actinomycetes bacterium]